MDRWGGDFVLWWITDPRRYSPLKNVLCPSAQGSEPCHPYGPQVMESPNCGWLGWWGCQLWKADEPLRLVGALGSLSPNLGKPLYKKNVTEKSCQFSAPTWFIIFYRAATLQQLELYMNCLGVNPCVEQQIPHEKMLASSFCKKQNYLLGLPALATSLCWCHGQSSLGRQSTGDLEASQPLSS